MKVTIVPLGDEDLEDLFYRSEFRDTSGALEAFKEHLRISDSVWVGKADDVVACAWGVYKPSMIGTQGYVWVLTSDIVDKHKITFVRYSKQVISAMLDQYEALIGFCSCERQGTARWLELLGAEFGPVYEVNKLPFAFRRK